MPTFLQTALQRHAGEKVYLKSLSPDGKKDTEYWITPKKLNRDDANQVRALYGKMLKAYDIEPDPKRSKGEQLSLIEAKYKVGAVEGTEKIGDQIAKIYFTGGVHEHNLFKDEEGKIPWDFKNEKTFEEFKKIPDTLEEIVSIVRNFNMKLEESLDESTEEGAKKNGNSETP